MEKRKKYRFDKHAAYKKYVGDLEKGEVTIIDGVVVGNEPDISKEDVLIAGFPLKISELLKENLIEQENYEELESFKDIKDLTEFKEYARKRKENWLKIVDTIIDYYGEVLPKPKQEKLKTLHHQTLEESQEILSSFEKKTIKYEDVIQKFAQLLGSLAYEELDIFKGENAAQRRRYRNWTGKELPDREKTIIQFTTAFKTLISGEYFKNNFKNREEEEEEEEKKEKEEKDVVSIMGNIQPAGTASAKMVYSKPYLIKEPFDPFRSFVKEIKVVEYAEENIGWEVKIFTAEHPIVPEPVYDAIQTITSPIGFNWDDIFGEYGAVHTSVLVGIFEVFQVRIEERALNNRGEILGTSKLKTRIYSRLDEWVVANGSCSWFQQRDTLHLKKTGSFFNRDNAVKYAKTSEPTPKKKKHHAIRACAYSVGSYSVNWVCHQNCNAFTLRKYDLICVTYPSTNIYGYFSNHPLMEVSKKDCPYSFGTQYGGVPGNSLHYHFYATYCILEPTMLITLNGIEWLMNRDGVGLREYWNYKQDEWRSTHARLQDQPSSSIGISGFTTLLREIDGWI